jgi:hypothetical protein
MRKKFAVRAKRFFSRMPIPNVAGGAVYYIRFIKNRH